jgi:hypothetical protein
VLYLRVSLPLQAKGTVRLTPIRTVSSNKTLTGQQRVSLSIGLPSALFCIDGGLGKRPQCSAWAVSLKGSPCVRLTPSRLQSAPSL